MSIQPIERRRPQFGLTHRLVLAREVAGLEQADLAEALGVGRSTISNYERGIGKRPINKLLLNAWAVACDVDVEWLKTGETEDPQPDPDGGLSGPPPGIEPGTYSLQGDDSPSGAKITALPVRRPNPVEAEPLRWVA